MDTSVAFTRASVICAMYQVQLFSFFNTTFFFPAQLGCKRFHHRRASGQGHGQAVDTSVFPYPARYVPSLFIAHRVQHSHFSACYARRLSTSFANSRSIIPTFQLFTLVDCHRVCQLTLHQCSTFRESFFQSLYRKKKSLRARVHALGEGSNLRDRLYLVRTRLSYFSTEDFFTINITSTEQQQSLFYPYIGMQHSSSINSSP